VPISLIVLAFMFATLGGILVPIVFAAITIPTTLGGVWILAHLLEMATYVTNIVTLLGIAIASSATSCCCGRSARSSCRSRRC